MQNNKKKNVSPAETAKSAIEAVNPNQTQTVESPYDTEYNESEKAKAEGRVQGTALKKRDRMSGNEAVALAIAESFTVTTWTTPHPLAVAVLLKAVLPHVPETVTVDVALAVIAADAQAARDNQRAAGYHRQAVYPFIPWSFRSG